MNIKLHPNIDAVAIISPNETMQTIGKSDGIYRFASVSKILSALVFAELIESKIVKFETKIDDEYFSKGDVTLEDLLSHASGIRPNYDAPIDPRTQRIYTNEAFELAERYVFNNLSDDLHGFSISTLFDDGLKEHLDASISYTGSCAHSAQGTFEDLVKLLNEMRQPSYLSKETMNKMTSTYLPGLSGILPGFGWYEDNCFGIGFEVKGNKENHWMGKLSSEKTFGHFGQSGAFVFHDPLKQISVACVTNKDFGPWAKAEYPKLSNQIYEIIVS